jgi:hypothetical protein
MGEIKLGIWNPKLSKSMMVPRKNMAYMAPFLR